MPHIHGIRVERREDCVILDAATRRNLELTANLQGGTENTVASVFDHAATPMGSRLFRRWLHRPLRNVEIITGRQQAITELLKEERMDDFQQYFRHVGDLERVLARVALKSARPRDLLQLRQALAQLPDFQTQLAPFHSARLSKLRKHIRPFPELADELKRAVIDNPPSVMRDGGVIANGYDEALDELRMLSENAHQFLIDLETREKARTNLSTLKVGYNRVHGYYIESSSKP